MSNLSTGNDEEVLMLPLALKGLKENEEKRANTTILVHDICTSREEEEESKTLFPHSKESKTLFPHSKESNTLFPQNSTFIIFSSFQNVAAVPVCIQKTSHKSYRQTFVSQLGNIFLCVLPVSFNTLSPANGNNSTW